MVSNIALLSLDDCHVPDKRCVSYFGEIQYTQKNFLMKTKILYVAQNIIVK